jgi:drug/metabolite transporter (DMT)-like permease
MVVLVVLLWSQLTGLVILVVVVVAGGVSLQADSFGYGVVAGVVGAGALALFYAGLAAGAMSLVAPLSACGAIVPVVVALAGGERVGSLAVVGMALALAGAVLVSRTAGGHLRLTPAIVAMAVGAGLAFGVVITLLQQGSEGVGDASISVVLASRVASFATIAGAVLATRTSPAIAGPSALVALLAVGIGDTGANLMLALASGGGDDAIAAVLASLYPVVTVVLARGVLGERLSAWQAAGVAAALAGVALVSAS